MLLPDASWHSARLARGRRRRRRRISELALSPRAEGDQLFSFFFHIFEYLPGFPLQIPTVLFFLFFLNLHSSRKDFFFPFLLEGTIYLPPDPQRIPARRPARPVSRCLFTLPAGDRRCLRLMLTRRGVPSGGEVKRDVTELFRGNRRQRAKSRRTRE